MSFQKNNLHIAYLKTEFSIEAKDGTLWVSPLRETQGLKEFLSRNGIMNWAIITPENPRSEVLSPEENQKRIAEFIKTGLHDEKTGERKWDSLDSISRPAPEYAADPERGFFIMNIFPWEAVRLGHQFGQNAIVIGKGADQISIVWCDHESQVAWDGGAGASTNPPTPHRTS